VAVIGCGAVGLGAVAAAANRGAMVVAIDIDPAKLAIARRAGAGHVLDTSREPLHESLQAVVPDGPDVIIEAVGSPRTFQAAVEEVAFTGRVVYIGYAKAKVEYETKLFVQKELDIRGSRNALDEFTSVMQVLEQGDFPTKDVVTDVVSLDQAGAALHRWSENPQQVTRILVNVEA
jgi:threonine dehydrogenase-like Zn-dependent dehydrogenase